MAQPAARGEIGRPAIGLIGSLAFTYVPWLIRGFRARYPDIRLSPHELMIAQQTDWFSDRRLQIGLLRPPLEVPGVELEILLREPFAMAIPDSYPLAQLDPVPVEALRGEPLTVRSEAQANWPRPSAAVAEMNRCPQWTASLIWRGS